MLGCYKIAQIGREPDARGAGIDMPPGMKHTLSKPKPPPCDEVPPPSVPKLENGDDSSVPDCVGDGPGFWLGDPLGFDAPGAPGRDGEEAPGLCTGDGIGVDDGGEPGLSERGAPGLGDWDPLLLLGDGDGPGLDDEELGLDG